MKRIIISLAVVFFSQAVCAAQGSGKPNSFVPDQRCSDMRNKFFRDCMDKASRLPKTSYQAGAAGACWCLAFMNYSLCMQRNSNPAVTK